MKSIRILTLSIILLFFNLKPAKSTLIQKIDVQAGLSNNCVHTIYKDNKGLIWIGTDNGFDSYDGLQIVSYGKRIKAPLKGSVGAIMEITPQSYLIGTSMGAYIYTPLGNTISSIKFETLAIDIRNILKDKTGQILMGTDKGVYILSADKKRAIPFIKELRKEKIMGMLQDSLQNTWIATEKKLLKINQQKRLMIAPFINGLFYNGINAISCIGNKLFIGTNNGLITLNTTNQNITTNREFDNIKINSLVSDGLNKLFVGTDNEGVIVYNINNHLLEAFKSGGIPVESISFNTISSLYYDNNGILWAGTPVLGFNKIFLQQNNRIKNLTISGLKYPNIRSFYITPLDEKFIGTRQGIIHLNANNQQVGSYKIGGVKIIKSNILTTIYPCPWDNELLLIGFYNGGIRTLNKSTHEFNYLSTIHTFIDGSIYKFHTDEYNNLWIASLDGLYRYSISKHKITRFDLSSLIGCNEIYSLDIDTKGRLWIGTRTGICYYSPTDRKFHYPKLLSNFRYQCTAMHCDNHGNSCFCFNKGGVLMINQNIKQEKWITTKIGLPQNSPVSVITDQAQNIWIGTHKDLYCINNKGIVRTYGVEDGIIGAGFCPESASRDSKGNLWWSNERGMVSYSPKESDTRKRSFNLLFTNLLINGNQYSIDTLSSIKATSPNEYEIKIRGHHNNNLEFKTAVLNYKSPENNIYIYELNGNGYLQKDTSSVPSISYNDLASGNYTLKIKVRDNEEYSSEKPLIITFSILPLFYETTWFYFIIIFIIGGTIIYFTRTYIFWMKDKIMSQLEESKKKQNATSGIQRVSDEKAEIIKAKLLSYMQDEKPYLNPELRQADVANAIESTVHEVSEVINSQLSLNFADFINSFRIEEIKRKMKSGEDKKFTMSAIAKQCGFNVNSSFIRAFKKATGVTPSQYFKHNTNEMNSKEQDLDSTE